MPLITAKQLNTTILGEDFTTPLTDQNGKALDWTVRFVLKRAAMLDGSEASHGDKLDAFELGMKIHTADGDLELTNAHVETLRANVAKAFPVIVAGQVLQCLK